MNYEMIWEAIKQPLRQGLLFLYALLLNKLFDWILSKFGFSFTEEQKEQLLGYGVAITWAILSGIDNLMHRIGKMIEEAGTKKNPVVSTLTRGLSRF